LEYPLVSIIIVNWNGKHLLGECLDSLSTQSFKDFEVIVVDNGSEDGSVAYIRNNYPWARLLSLEENIGYAGGNNAGMRIAQGSFIALLNNDTVVDPCWLEYLDHAIRTSSPKTGMWASKILSYGNPEILDNAGLLLYPDGLGRGKGRLEKDSGQYDQDHEALFPSGCAGLYRKEMLDQIGLLDETFFAYADDVSLGLRARLAGWECLFVPCAKVYHKYSSSSSAYSTLKAFLVERNRIWVLWKYFPIELILMSPFFTAQRFFMHAYAALQGKGASARFSDQHSFFKGCMILMKAWWAALRGLPWVMRERYAFSKHKTLSRWEFYRLLWKFRISAYEVAMKE